MRAPYRLGIDIGTNSLGWCVFDLKRNGEPYGIRRIGVRIFPDGRDPQSQASLAEARRLPRQQRRRRDRYLNRRADLMKALVKHGLMPADEAGQKGLEKLDPYELRAKGLDEPLPLHHLGRAIFHLNQRRGFKSNRRTDRPADPDKAKEAAGMKEAISLLAERIRAAGHRTLGEHLYRTAREGRGVREHLPVRARPHTVKGRNAYDFYPSREMLEEELDALWQAQARHHQELTEEARSEIRDIILFQRPLKPVSPGKCALDPEDERAPLALPIVQQFRILQELANLRLEEPVAQTVRCLTFDERDKLFAELRGKDKLSFAGIRKSLKLGSDVRINLEEARRSELKGDGISARLAKESCFGPRWLVLPEEHQTEIVQRLLDEPDEERLIDEAMRDWDLDEAHARAVAATPLPQGYGRVGLTALRKIVPIMLAEAGEDGGPLHYNEAAERAGYNHSELRTGEVFDRMPYYGEVLSRYVADVKSASASPDEREHGRIANPTVHIGLNQLRKLLNALIQEYGKPAEIVVELARDLRLSREEKERIHRDQTENKRKNDLRRQKLEEIGESNRGDGLLRMRLWEELGDNPADRRCIYTGEQISVRRLFSEEVEIEHILPFRDTLDDSPANLTVSLRRANRDKGKRTPYEAFHAHAGYDWDEIVKRSASLPANKRWRFKPDALELVRDRAARDLAKLKGLVSPAMFDDIERTGGFLARQLVDTAYLARVARQYLWSVCESPDNVWVVPGRLTEFMRRKWGLNRLLYGNRPDPAEDAPPGQPPKRRDDHRHHAIDAFVVGLTSRSILQRVSTAAARSEERTIEEMPEPWEGFRDDLGDRLGRLTISYKPDHGTSPNGRPPHSTTGRLHEDKAYGIVDENTLVYRKPLADLNANEVLRIRDAGLKTQLKEELGGLLFDESLLDAAKEALAEARRSRDTDAIASAKVEVERLKQAEKELKKTVAKNLRSALVEFGERHGIRRVRLLKTEAGFVPICEGSGKPYKAVIPGDNHCIDVVEPPDGAWKAESVTVFDANQAGSKPTRRNDPMARLVMRLHKGDLMRLVVDGVEKTMRVVRLEPANDRLRLAGHLEAGNLDQRHNDPDDQFRWEFMSFNHLKLRKARKVTVDMLGRINDPGPPR